MEEHRQPGKVRHFLKDLVKTRVYAVVLGYSDYNDVHSLRSDPARKLDCRALPSANDLARQPTLSRFENAVSSGDLKLAVTAVAREVLKQVPTDTMVVMLGVNATHDPCHRQQQLELFNRYYHKHCYVRLPVHRMTFVPTLPGEGYWLSLSPTHGEIPGAPEPISILPAVPLYWRLTPTDLAAFFRKPVSSTISRKERTRGLPGLHTTEPGRQSRGQLHACGV